MLEPQVEGSEYEDNANVYHQPRPKVVLEEEDVNTNHDAYKRKHVDHDGYVSSHVHILLSPASRENPSNSSRASWGVTLTKRRSRSRPRPSLGAA